MRERWADLDLVSERSDASEIVLGEAREELRRGRAQQGQIALHAAGDVEHHDEANRLRLVLELRERLRMTVVPDLEVLARERRHEAAVLVRDGREDADDVAAAAKGRGLLARRAQRAHETDGQCSTRKESCHAVPFIGRHLH